MKLFVTGTIILFIHTASVCPALSEGLTVDVWYGDEQHFGHLGHPQKWVNILGHVSPAEEIQALHYSLNGAEPLPLSYLEDRKRIAKDGDFNVEIDRALLRPGKNSLRIMALDTEGNTVNQTVAVHYIDNGKKWPLPYSIDWSEVDTIREAAQVVDGKWRLTQDGVRVVERYYDRVIAFGDDSWRDYEVTTPVIFHGFTQPKTPPNTTGVTHAAIATRWPGHDADGKQPSVKWHPLGATAEFRLGYDLSSCRWRIFDGKITQNVTKRYYVEEDRRRTIELEKTYWMKHRVETLDNGTSLYRVKFWPDGQPEPVLWDLTRTEPTALDILSGSALLIAHHTDVTFGDVKAVPIE